MKLRKFVVSFLACSIALSLAVGLTGCGAQNRVLLRRALL